MIDSLTGGVLEWASAWSNIYCSLFLYIKKNSSSVPLLESGQIGLISTMSFHGESLSRGVCKQECQPWLPTTYIGDYAGEVTKKQSGGIILRSKTPLS